MPLTCFNLRRGATYVWSTRQNFKCHVDSYIPHVAHCTLHNSTCHSALVKSDDGLLVTLVQAVTLALWALAMVRAVTLALVRAVTLALRALVMVRAVTLSPMRNARLPHLPSACRTTMPHMTAGIHQNSGARIARTTKSNPIVASAPHNHFVATTGEKHTVESVVGVPIANTVSKKRTVWSVAALPIVSTANGRHVVRNAAALPIASTAS